MVSKRQRILFLTQPLVFASGCGVLFALNKHLFACTLLLALIGVWSAAAAFTQVRAEVPPRIESASSSTLNWQVVSRVLDQLPMPLAIQTPDGVLRAGNRAARDLFKTDERILKAPVELLAALGDPDATGRRTVALGLQGENRTYALSVIDVLGADGPRRLAMLLDIQPEIRTAEASALRDMMQVLSHEIMNALTPVASLASTALDLMRDGTATSNETARDAVETVARRAEGLSRFVEAYRALAKLPPPIARPTSIGALLDEAAQVFRSRWPESQVQLSVRKPSPDIIVDLDRDLMVHALMNVMSNAADASIAAALDFASVVVAAEPRDARIVLIVSDNGPGIPMRDRERVFQPFFTTKTDGTGVGLSFARQVALSHGGELSLAPHQQFRGATFELSI